MSTQSFPFDFQRTPNFFSGFNTGNGFSLSNMNLNNANFQFKFASYSPNNIEECLDGNKLDATTVTVIQTVNAKLVWNNNEEIISVGEDVEWNIGSHHYPLQAIFLVDKDSQFVMGYSIHPSPFNVTNELIIPQGTILWSFIDGN